MGLTPEVNRSKKGRHAATYKKGKPDGAHMEPGMQSVHGGNACGDGSAGMCGGKNYHSKLGGKGTADKNKQGATSRFESDSGDF